MAETSEDVVSTGIVEDIAALARKLAEKEPFKSATGPEALLALAAHLDEMLTTARGVQPAVVRVPIRARRRKRDE